MPIDNRARDLALGIAAALEAGEDITEAKLAVVTYLSESDPGVRAERLLAYVNANAVMIAQVMDIAPRWYNLGWLHGALHHDEKDPSKLPEPPDSNTLFQHLAQEPPTDDSPEATA